MGAVAWWIAQSEAIKHQLGGMPFKDLGLSPRKEVSELAKTEQGKKIVPVKPYDRKVNGKVSVRRHRRSTPN